MDEVSLHARSMLLAWFVLVPVGILAARFFKIMPRQDWPREIDNRVWWVTHQVVLYAAMAIALGSVVYIVSRSEGFAWSSHSFYGVGAVTLGVLQIVAGWLRGTKGGPTDKGADPGDPSTWRGDHYDMTPRRLWFEAWHKLCGYAAVGFALAAVVSGMEAAKWGMASTVRMLAVLTFWVAAFVLLARFKRRVSTYRAIWGDDPGHPGNRPPFDSGG